MNYRRMPIEIESPEQMGYANLDCNLTESSFADARLSELDLDLSGLLLCYGDHLGKPELRQRIAESCGVGAGDVLVTPGAAAALFIVSTSLLRAGDRLLVVRPNYATNIETPRALGAQLDFLELDFDRGFRLDLDELARRITPQTRLVSLTVPHNPTGTMMSAAELRAAAELVGSRGALLLVDETYREMAFGAPLPSGASLGGAHVIAVSSLSKSYGLPGIRMGWLACRDPKLMETFLAAKEQIVICNSVVDEEIAHRALAARERRLPGIRETIRAHFGIVRDWIAGEGALEWVEPSGGVVCFPRIRSGSGVDVGRFYEVLNRKYRTFVGPGHWFEQDRRYMRIGFGWPKTDELSRGLENVSRALAEAR
jgi:aspartate/methionine/tyrosine aminotransferase